MTELNVEKFKSWSYSRYALYKQCPFKAKLLHIDKIKEPPSEALARGRTVHDNAEAYIKGKLPSMPVELKKFPGLFRRLRRQYKKVINGLVVEDTWALTDSWDETTWDDWANCWLRIKLDLAEIEEEVVLIVRDWKTGKFRESDVGNYMEQLELYALAALILLPHISVVKPKLYYLDSGMVYPREVGSNELSFTREDIPRLKKTWEGRVRAMMNDTIFAPRPNQFCNWCFYRKSNAENGGGQCKY